MRMVDPLIAELDQESNATRRLLERVPGDRLDWRPHPTSMPLGELALHVAQTPGAVAELMLLDEVGLPDFENRPQPESSDQLLPALDAALARAKEVLSGMDDARAMEDWQVVHEGNVKMALPRIGLARAIMLNHWYHHRGQLCVYLRMLGVPVPAVYGASADENPLMD